MVMHLRQHKHIWAAIFLKLASDIAKYVGKSENVWSSFCRQLITKYLFCEHFTGTNRIIWIFLIFFNTVKQMVIINYDWILGIFFSVNRNQGNTFLKLVSFIVFESILKKSICLLQKRSRLSSIKRFIWIWIENFE